jgi:hypothetical protein
MLGGPSTQPWYPDQTRRKSLWDSLPYEIKTRILKQSDALTRTLHGYFPPRKLRQEDSLDSEVRKEAWIAALEGGYDGSMHLLPKLCDDIMGDVLEHSASLVSESMHCRLAAFKPSHATISESFLDKHNTYENVPVDETCSRMIRSNFVNIHMRNNRTEVLQDLIRSYPISCAKIALFMGHLEFFRYLVTFQKFEPVKLKPFTFQSTMNHDIDLVMERSVLYYVTCQGDLNLARLLLDHGLQPDIDCIEIAVSHAPLALVQLYLERVAHLFALSSTAPNYLLNNTATQPTLDVSKFLRSTLGYLCKLSTIRAAVDNANTNMLQWIIEAGDVSIQELAHQSLYVSYNPKQRQVYKTLFETLLQSGFTMWTRQHLDFSPACDDLSLVMRIQNTSTLETKFTEMALTFAVMNVNLTMVKYLVETMGVPIRIFTLFQAMYHCPEKITMYLIENTKITSSCSDLLIAATSMGHFKIVRYLLQKGVIPRSERVFSDAAQYGRLDIFLLLREHPVKFARPQHPQRYLALACQENQFEFVKFFYERDETRPVLNADLVIAYAIENLNPDIVAYLMPKVRCWKGLLAIAVATGELKMVEYIYRILEAGKNYSGPEYDINVELQGAIRLAERNCMLDILQFLRDKI